MADLGIQPEENLGIESEDLGITPEKSEKESPIKKSLKGAAGAGEAGLEVIPKMIIGGGGLSAGYASDIAADVLKGEWPSHEKAMKEAERRQHQVTDWRLFDEAKPVEEAIGEGFDKIKDVLGRGAERLTMRPAPSLLGPVKPPSAVATTEEPEARGNIARTGAEPGSNFIPLPFLHES